MASGTFRPTLDECVYPLMSCAKLDGRCAQKGTRSTLGCTWGFGNNAVTLQALPMPRSLHMEQHRGGATTTEATMGPAMRAGIKDLTKAIIELTRWGRRNNPSSATKES
jgi:hypothetical protein